MKSLVDRLCSLESESRKLDPSEDQADAMTNEVQEFVLRSLRGSRGGEEGSEGASSAAPAWQYSGPDAAKELETEGLQETPAEALGDLLALVDRNVLKEGSNHSSSRFFGWVPGGGLYASALGDYLAAASGRFAGYWLANPGAVRMENLLVQWATQQVAGYDVRTSGGFLASGASLATVSALLCARDAHKVLTNPTIPADNRVVYLSSQVHGCVQKALSSDFPATYG